ncbi:Rieske domain-containing protein-like [Liolophura sinensis]|uniref:Rieske domain-containing protein-like n=1 Tax=Liolophura sinensis TaxID=3198878 RepID=UPI00315812D8
MPDEPKLFLPVSDVKYGDLFDWSDPLQKKLKHTRISRRPSVSRQNSKTGTLTECNDVQIALFRYGEEVFALDEKCPHAGGPLHLGDIETLPDMSVCVRCPWHSWRFELKTGQVRQPKGRQISAKIYPVQVKQDGTLLVGFSELNSKYFTDEDF